jgi:hypothetical protein
MFLAECERRNFRHIKNIMQNYVSMYFNICIFV